ncbi:YppE family protein [Alkalihalophilus lindianensis]|uniref:YppE family protein n=1 Tax=Alkalihalophilus lindianensis TaxID=1630542 RepID=A0ABU3X6L2_9BACI|nr:YppE family protein [Alkalihalophilus lindianensis]MDV2683517.1 YppE family protein [Alkalihalophilus lindianensis]
MNKDERKLEELTEELLHLNSEAESYYLNQVRKEGYEPDFFGVVKPFADRVKIVSDEWKPLAEQFVLNVKPSHLYPIQIGHTHDNLEVVAIKSFYPKTGLKKQIETFKSVAFVLHQLRDELKAFQEEVE